MTASAIDVLLEGYKQFRSVYAEEKPEIYRELVVNGQRPKALVIACCDSRVDPAVITNAAPGDLLVVRNMANVVPAYEDAHAYHSVSAEMEFAVLKLEVTDIIIMGHSHCGGIASIMQAESGQQSEFIGDWMRAALPAKEKVLEEHPDLSLTEQTHLCERQSLLRSYQNLLTFPWIKARVDANKLHRHAWYFDLGRCEIQTYDENAGVFRELLG